MGMKRFAFILLCLIFALKGAGLAASAPASPHAAVFNPAEFQSELQQRVAGQTGVGIIVGIIDHDKVSIYQAGSTGTARPLDEHTLFEIGSVTKTFTATILASMVLDGSVSLSDPVAKYLPSDVKVPSRNGKQITLLNLATQHSGLPRLPDDFNPADPDDPYADYTVDKLYAFLNSYKLPRDPGASYEYSNLGIGLLGTALADRADMPYEELLAQRVLEPLRMTETAVTVPPRLEAQLAQAHDVDGDVTKRWYFQAIAPAGGINSSLSDMLKYLRCAMGQGELAKACLFAEQPRDTIPGNRIGLVWWTENARHIVNHGGDTYGYHAWIAVSPDRTRGVVVLTNGGTSVDGVAIHVMDPSSPLTQPQKVAKLDRATLDQYVGTYKARKEGLTFTILRVDDKLEAQLSGQSSARIYPSTKDHFYYRIVDATIDFTRDASGKVNALVLHQEGQTVVAVRPGATAPSVAQAQPSFPPVVALDSATLNSYLGTYVAGEGLAFTVTRQSDQLMVQVTGQESYPVFASAKDHVYYKIVNAQIDFERDGNGNVVDLILHQNGRDIKAIKQPSAS